MYYNVIPLYICYQSQIKNSNNNNNKLIKLNKVPNITTTKKH